MTGATKRFYEFFAGAGMARAGLGSKWRCLFANDFDKKKAATYARNWGADNFLRRDVREVTTDDLPDVADLVWASFPCQDLSLAGGGAGLRGERSGAFWPFWRLMTALADESRAPSVIVLENVCGTLSSHGRQDFEAIMQGASRRRLPIRGADRRRRSFRAAIPAPAPGRCSEGRCFRSRRNLRAGTDKTVPPASASERLRKTPRRFEAKLEVVAPRPAALAQCRFLRISSKRSRATSPGILPPKRGSFSA